MSMKWHDPVHTDPPAKPGTGPASSGAARGLTPKHTDKPCAVCKKKIAPGQAWTDTPSGIVRHLGCHP